MKNYFLLVVISTILLTCQQDDLFKTTNSVPEIDLTSISDGVSQPDDLIVLGERTESPYTVENMNKALASLKKSARAVNVNDYEITTTHRYVKFIPQSEAHVDSLSTHRKLLLYTYPLDRKIVSSGGYYIDPDAPSDKPMPLYATVEADYKLPTSVPYKTLLNLHNPEESEEYSVVASVNQRHYEFFKLLEEESNRLLGKEISTKSSSYANRRWVPSGRITTYDSSKGTYVGVYDLKVLFRKGLFSKYTFTDSNGYFRSRKSFSDDVSYCFYFQRHDFKITTPGRSHAESVTIATLRKPLSLKFASNDIRSYYANIFRATAHYYFQDIKSLSRPPGNAALRRALKIVANRTQHPDNPLIAGSHTSNTIFFSRESLINIYDSSSETKSIYGTVIHELAHASHWRHFGKYFEDTDLIVKESWARGVEWSLTSSVYSDYKASYHTIYTGVVEDMIDFDTSIAGSGDNDKRREYVVGYTIGQLEETLDSEHTWTSWKNKIKSEYNNANEHHLDPLFDIWN